MVHRLFIVLGVASNMRTSGVVKHRLVYCLILLPLAAAIGSANSTVKDQTETSEYIENQFIPYRYNRYFFFFFSGNVTISFFNENIKKTLVKMDSFCGDENFQTKVFFGNDIKYTLFPGACPFCNIEDILNRSNRDNLIASKAKNISAGGVDKRDVNNISAMLIQQSRAIDFVSVQPNGVNITTQVILITDYATESLRSNYTKSVLEDLQTKNVKFIALTTNLTNTSTCTYFPEEIWSVFLDYINWTPEMNNPICGYESQQYTTPSFQDESFEFYIYLFLSFDYVNETQLSGIVQLIHQLTLRRWLHPCRELRFIHLQIVLPFDGTRVVYKTCYIDDSLLNAPKSEYSGAPVTTLCSVALFRSWFSNNHWQNNQQNAACANIYSKLFDRLMIENHDQALRYHKYIIITDEPLPCPGYDYITQPILRNFSDYATGAPFTVIAIDKENDKSVVSSYAPLFPATQRSNLYEVNNISELLENMNTSINICVDTWPWYDQKKTPYSTQSLWFYYLIGAAILLTFLVGFSSLLVIKRKRKRRKNLSQIRDRVEFITLTVGNTRNQDDSAEEPVIKDDWEVSLNKIDIDFVTILGRGAFSLVHKGYLHGEAPVAHIFSSITLQQFSDCFVAVKTVPQHCSETEKTKFRKEILLMKDIGYNVHLVSILGCNCSIERPILLMELAKQDLLHWLAEINGSTETQIEPKLEKTLLSISWQISDGMSYLSSKNFVHRDVAARNVLLNNEMKAMISDFGLCMKLDCAEQVIAVPGGILPLKWMALESLQYHHFSLKTDVWTFGVLLFEIFSLGQVPYAQIPVENLVTFLCHGNRLDRPGFAKEQMYDLMRQCWDMDATRRPNFVGIQSTFFRMLEETASSYEYLQANEEDNLN